MHRSNSRNNQQSFEQSIARSKTLRTMHLATCGYHTNKNKSTLYSKYKEIEDKRGKEMQVRLLTVILKHEITLQQSTPLKAPRCRVEFDFRWRLKKPKQTSRNQNSKLKTNTVYGQRTKKKSGHSPKIAATQFKSYHLFTWI